jgi:hypothetical protein
MKNSDVNICAVIESKMNEIMDEISEKHSIKEQDPLDSESRILDWIFYQVCSNKKKNFLTDFRQLSLMLNPHGASYLLR